jgi:hypothetical protein
MAGNVDWDGEHCRFCRFLSLFGDMLRSDRGFKPVCRDCRCRYAAKAARMWQDRGKSGKDGNVDGNGRTSDTQENSCSNGKYTIGKGRGASRPEGG